MKMYPYVLTLIDTNTTAWQACGYPTPTTVKRRTDTNIEESTPTPYTPRPRTSFSSYTRGGDDAPISTLTPGLRHTYQHR